VLERKKQGGKKKGNQVAFWRNFSTLKKDKKIASQRGSEIGKEAPSEMIPLVSCWFKKRGNKGGGRKGRASKGGRKL